MSRDPASTPVAYHQQLLLDRERTEAYRRAIEETVKPGDVVLDLGTGIGILALFACRAGAARVYAIESGAAIELARVLCQANGHADRVRLVPQMSTFVRLPEPADVLVTETLGCAGLEERLLSSVLDARERMLKPGGRMVPFELEIFAAPIELGERHQRFDVWSSGNYGLDLSSLRPFAVNGPWRETVGIGNLLAPPSCLARFDLTAFTDCHLRAKVAFIAGRAGALHGFACWFGARLSESVSLTNAPPLRTPNWSHLVLPLERELAVAPGDRMDVAVSSLDGREWRWQVTLEPADGRPASRLDQATLWSHPISGESLHRKSKSYRPQPSGTTRAVQFLIGELDGSVPVEELERRLFEEFPEIFPTRHTAAFFVAKLLPEIT